jgi:hypothetical protein
MLPAKCRKSREDIIAYEKAHGLGAAWGEEENRAVVRVFDPEGKIVRNYATGLRNCSGMAIQPGTGTLWRTGNERDHIGPNLSPDYLTSVKDGARRVPPGRHRAEPQDAGPAPHPAATTTRLRVSCVSAQFA